MKLLLVEDDPLVIKALQRGLSPHYLIEVSQTGTQALDRASGGSYDAILLDLKLPDMNGFEVCQQLRQDNIATPIIVISGQTDIPSKIQLLDAGADDYLTKPFNLDELRARLRTILRREAKTATSSTLTVGDLILNSATRRVERAGRAIRLRRKEFDLLEYMMLHAGSVVTRENIIAHIWDINDAIWTNAVDVHIKYLRDKIDRPFPRHLISTVYGVGYRLELSNAVALNAYKKGGDAENE